MEGICLLRDERRTNPFFSLSRKSTGTFRCKNSGTFRQEDTGMVFHKEAEREGVMDGVLHP
jgi:hypothetical protein